MNAPQANIHRTVADMAGQLEDFQGNQIDPCDEYAGFPSGCPTAATAGFDIAVGRQGLPDIVSVGALLRAAGIGSLDSVAGLAGADAGESRREAGLVLNLDIQYTNFYQGVAARGRSGAVGTGSVDNSYVTYTYAVSTVPRTEYKFVTGAYPYGNATVRENLNRHGLRILVTTSGRIGYFDFMTLLINLNVAAGLLGLTYIAMDAMITQCSLSCCPLRGVYRQFKERKTVDMSDLRKIAAADPAALRKLQERFEADPYVVDPNPEVLALTMTGGGGGGGEEGGGGGGSGGGGASRRRGAWGLAVESGVEGTEMPLLGGGGSGSGKAAR